jgi:hypothetical protein
LVFTDPGYLLAYQLPRFSFEIVERKFHVAFDITTDYVTDKIKEDLWEIKEEGHGKLL